VRVVLATFSFQCPHHRRTRSPPPWPQPRARAMRSSAMSGAARAYPSCSVGLSSLPDDGLSLSYSQPAAAPPVACNVGSHTPPLTPLPQRKLKCVRSLPHTHPFKGASTAASYGVGVPYSTGSDLRSKPRLQASGFRLQDLSEDKTVRGLCELGSKECFGRASAIRACSTGWR